MVFTPLLPLDFFTKVTKQTSLFLRHSSCCWKCLWNSSVLYTHVLDAKAAGISALVRVGTPVRTRELGSRRQGSQAKGGPVCFAGRASCPESFLPVRPSPCVCSHSYCRCSEPQGRGGGAVATETLLDPKAENIDSPAVIEEACWPCFRTSARSSPLGRDSPGFFLFCGDEILALCSPPGRARPAPGKRDIWCKHRFLAQVWRPPRPRISVSVSALQALSTPPSPQE